MFAHARAVRDELLGAARCRGARSRHTLRLRADLPTSPDWSDPSASGFIGTTRGPGSRRALVRTSATKGELLAATGQSAKHARQVAGRRGSQDSEKGACGGALAGAGSRPSFMSSARASGPRRRDHAPPGASPAVALSRLATPPPSPCPPAGWPSPYSPSRHPPCQDRESGPAKGRSCRPQAGATNWGGIASPARRLRGS